jgi:hypothetical protein
MELKIGNVFTGQESDIRGNPMEIEELLRNAYGGAFSYIPHGDLAKVLDALNRMYGYSVSITEATNYSPAKRRFNNRPLASADPWPREIDEPFDPDSRY